MKRIKKSFGHAVDGFTQSVKTEKNLQLFLPVYILVLLAGAGVRLLNWEWLALITAGAMFVSVELLNTAVERLTDVLDDQKKANGRQYHATMKAAKDIGAAASLVSLVCMIAVTLVVFGPYVRLLVS